MNIQSQELFEWSKFPQVGSTFGKMNLPQYMYQTEQPLHGLGGALSSSPQGPYTQ